MIPDPNWTCPRVIRCIGGGHTVLRDRPIWTPLVPVAAVGLLIGVMSLGGAFLGWGP